MKHLAESVPQIIKTVLRAKGGGGITQNWQGVPKKIARYYFSLLAHTQ